MPSLDPRLIEAFRAVAKSGSATRAAMVLNTTQPTITRAVADLEMLCKFRLFERGRHGMTLTPQGEALMGAVERSFVGLQIIQKTIGDIRNGVDGALTAIAIPVVAEGVLGTLLGGFMKAHPNVSVRSINAAPDEILRAVLNGAVDFGAIVGAPPVGGHFDARPIGARTLVLVVAAEHRLAGCGAVHVQELDGEAIVLLTSPHNIRSAVETMMINFGVRAAIVHEAMTQRNVAQLVLNSQAVGFVDGELFAEAIPPGLSILRLEPAVFWPINLIQAKARLPSFVLHRFLEWLDRALPELAEP